MSEVEIYKIKKTTPPEVREYSAFDYMRNGEPPNPLHYVREWAGEMHGTLPLTIPGRLMLNPPEGYQGGEIKNGDIAVVDGTPYFLDRLSGYKFVETDFDAAAVRDAIHVRYGWFVDVKGAEPISDNLSYVCEDIGIPCGYLGETKAAIGIYNDRRPFLPGASGENHLSFLHPEFMKGEEARTFISLLAELTDADRWPRIFDYLREHYPVNQQDLEKARELFAPELLLPVELRPLSKFIPVGAEQADIDYLVAKIGGMNDKQRTVFDAVTEAGWHCASVAEIINLTENLGCFRIEPMYNEAEYGAYRLERDWDLCEETANRLEKSEDPTDQALRKYIMLLGRCAEDETYGYHASKEEDGVFTQHGFVSQVRGLEELYCGIQDIPDEYRTSEPFVVESDAPIMVKDADLSALLLQMHAVGGDFMCDVKHNIKTLVSGGTDFFVMMNSNLLIITPIDEVFRKETSAHGAWMHTSGEPDVRAFVMSVTERRDDCVVFGSLYEVDSVTLINHINKNSIEHSNPADEGQLAAFLDNFLQTVKGNRRAVPAEVFLSQISDAYMAQSHKLQSEHFRIAPEAARDIVAQNAADVFKFHPEPFAQMQPIDAAKPGLWVDCKCEFSIRHDAWEKLDKWAKNAVKNIQRQNGRDERKQAKNKGEEL